MQGSGAVFGRMRNSGAVFGLRAGSHSATVEQAEKELAEPRGNGESGIS
jgi:hypothetical protein